MNIKPYFQNEWVTLYCGDCRDILPKLHFDTLITDPVWPNAIAVLEGSDRPYELFAEMWNCLGCLPKRAAIHLGTDSDPRFLLAVPETLKFFRTVHLAYAMPSRRGRLLQGNDTAYLFGAPPPVRPGARVIPGESQRVAAGKESQHPCSRKLRHASWLVSWWSEPSDVVVDPFCGSGTTLLAAQDLGRKAIGIEINAEYCEMAAQRLGQRVLCLN